MKASGNTTRRAPLRPASAISSRALAMVASRSRNTGVACTAAILKVATIVHPFPFSEYYYPTLMMGHGKSRRICRRLFIHLGAREGPKPGSPRHPHRSPIETPRLALSRLACTQEKAVGATRPVGASAERAENNDV